MGAGAAVGFGILSKANIKFMDNLCNYLQEIEFATHNEIYEEYMNKPRSGNFLKSQRKDNQNVNWGSIKPTRNSLGWILKILPFVNSTDYRLHSTYMGRKVIQKGKLWTLNSNWGIELELFKRKLKNNIKTKTAVKYHKVKCGEYRNELS
jgi:hypothetical protein